MRKVIQFLTFSLSLLLVFSNRVPYAFSESTVWDLNAPGEYNVSSTTKIKLDGALGKLTVTGLTGIGSLGDNATTELEGANDVMVIGNYAYVVSVVDDGLSIVDISNPATPTHVGAITDNGTTELDGAFSLRVIGNYAYVVSFNDDGFSIIDISNPATPTHVGAITDNGTTLLLGPTGVDVVGDYAYIATNAESGFQILDISDPANPTHVSATSDNGATLLANASGVDVVGDYAYVTSGFEDGVEILDISNPATPTHVGAITDNGTTELDSPRGIVVAGDYAYVVADVDDGVEVLDISDPTTPTHVTSITDDGTLLLDGAFGIDVVGDYIYVASRTDNGLQILSIDRPTDSPYITPTTGQAFDSTVDTFAHILGGNNEGTVTYQVSTDNGSTWNYWTGANWATTTAIDGTETNNVSDINTNISTLDTDGGTLLWRAYLNSDGLQEVELDEVSITYDIPPTNNPPTDIQIDGANTDSQNENTGANTDIGTLTTTDPDGGDTHTYSLACSTPGADDAHFNISGDQLRNTTVFDFENPGDANTDNSYEVCVRTTDSGTGNLTYDETLTITINNLNNAPTNIDIDGADTDSLNENTAANTNISTITSTDDGEDNTESYTYSLTCNTPGADDAHFNVSSTNLRNTTVFDFENPVDTGTDNTYNICLRVTETNGGLTYDENFTITVTDVNVAPTDIQIDGANGTSVNENVTAGSSVGTLSGTDDGENIALTFSLVAGAGDTDNAAFTVDGNELDINASPDFETQSSYSVRVQGNDGALTITEAFIITVNDLDEVPPVITLLGTTPISVNQNDTYIDVGATCSDDVDPICNVVVTFNPVDTAVPGIYTITYDAQDTAGNDATQVTRTVEVLAVATSTRTQSGRRRYTHQQAAALFAQARGETLPETTTCTPLTQNLKAPSRNGSYNTYTGGIVTEADTLQEHLNRLGFNSGPVDGIIGPLTDGAIKRMQTSLGVIADGFVGPITRGAINASC